MEYRKLSADEIAALEAMGNSSTDWTRVQLAGSVDSSRIRNTCFDGDVKIGVLEGEVDLGDGIVKASAILDSYISNCEIGNGSYIAKVANLVNYKLEEGVAIENVGTLAVTGESSFGNGVEIEVFNEGGGRDLKIFDRLNSQLAYFLVAYRHDKKMIAALEKLVDSYCESQKSSTGLIAKGARVLNSTTILNVKIGEKGLVSGASLLEEGTLASTAAHPASIGDSVTAKGFIVLSGSKISGGAILANTFVGQGCQIGKQYSAENSTFFANCEGFHGEACSIYGGPYTVTHHKSTLLIAGMFSFFNAGSGTNQSNHMYKLGPLHQGVLERGAKTGSFSYLLWPARVGAYTAVIGKHYANFDASDLPFSYITEEGGKSVITPAMNLFTVGTRRDYIKWPSRDRRKDTDKFDLLSFEFLSPYVMGKVEAGSNALLALYESTPRKAKWANHKGIQISRLMLKTSRKYYEMLLRIFAGDLVAAALEKLGKDVGIDGIRSALKGSDQGTGTWIDVSGMVSPQAEIDALLGKISAGSYSDLDAVSGELKALFVQEKELSLNWAIAMVKRKFDVDLSQATPEELKSLLESWKKDRVKLNNMILKDAEKEFDQNSSIGFGIDGDEEVRAADFATVRGTYDENKFVVELRKENEELALKADALITQVEGLASATPA